MGEVRNVLGAAAVATALLMLAGCAGPPSAPGPTASAPATTVSDSAVGTWGDAADPRAPSLSLAADGALTGSDGCNRIIGTWAPHDGAIEFGDLATTRRACEGLDTWLSTADSATISGDTMTVYADDGAEIGTLERASEGRSTPSPSPGAEGTGADFVGTWGIADRSHPHLVIAADGTVSGSDGCNAMAGTWEVDDDGSLEFDDMVMTLMACPGGDQTLNRLDSATVADDLLTVFDDHGAVLATLPRTA